MPESVQTQLASYANTSYQAQVQAQHAVKGMRELASEVPSAMASLDGLLSSLRTVLKNKHS
jgi:hypothetical protein